MYVKLNSPFFFLMGPCVVQRRLSKVFKRGLSVTDTPDRGPVYRYTNILSYVLDCWDEGL